jgi:hypothetical protein
MARYHGGNSRFPPWAPLPETHRTLVALVGRARLVGRGREELSHIGETAP